MKIKVFSEKNKLYEQVARTICERVKFQPSTSLGLATGNTQIPIYEAIVRIARDELVSFKNVSSFNLDEYVGLPEASNSSFKSYMKRHFFDHVDIDTENSYFPYTDNNKTIHENIFAFERAVEIYGGIDFQLLGIGRNGHIGFNEPYSDRYSSTRLVSLTEETLEDNKKDLEEEHMPTTAVTMGINTIYKARSIILIAIGIKKAQAIKDMIEGKVSSACPASFLMDHPELTIYADSEAISSLKDRERFI